MGSFTSPETAARLFLACVAAALLSRAPARADIDLNGPWRVLAQTSPYLNPDLSCIVDVVQTAGAITVTGTGCSVPINLSGTINTVSGAISAGGASDPILCPTMLITATATPASDAFSGTFDCNGIIPVSGPFSGGLCANGELDAGEDCDDSNLETNDCCSATCEFEPASYVCFAGGLCTNDHCDGAGTCVSESVPAGMQCEDDGNSCTDNVCNGSGMCTHPLFPAGTACSGDFNECTDDTCDGAGTCVVANNTAPCDDWNSCTVGDACAAGTCVPGTGFAPAGIACDTDFDLCTVDECDGAGGCQNVECSLCCGAPGCNPAIGATCAHPIEPAATLYLRGGTGDDDKDKLIFKWKSGAATAPIDFGDPTTGTKYEMCVFDSSLAPQTNLEFQARAPAGGTCDGKPCWQAKSSGYAYKDKGLTPGGLEKIRLRSGAAGAAQILVKGGGANLQLGRAGFYFQAPLTAQVRASNGKCWQADFPTILWAGGALKGKGGD